MSGTNVIASIRVKLQVLWTIIGSLTVAVVHTLRLSQRTSENSLHDKAVLEYRPLSNFDGHVTLRRYCARALWSTLLAGLLFFHVPSIAHLDHILVFEQAPYGRLDKYNPAILELRQTNIFRWRYEQDAGGIDRLSAVAQALDEISADFGVFMLPDPAGFPIFSSAGGDFIYGNSRHGACGSWAIGCVTEFPTNPKVVVDTSTMASWPLRSVLEVLLHELFHLAANLAEGYREGYVYGTTSCAPVDDGGVVAGIHRSLMNCGLLNAQVIDTYIRFAWAYSHFPSPVAGAALVVDQGRAAIFYAATDARATRIAVIIDRGTGPEWAGVYGSPCTVPGIVCGGVDVPLLPQTCYWAKAENSLSWSFALTEILAGCTS